SLGLGLEQETLPTRITLDRAHDVAEQALLLAIVELVAIPMLDSALRLELEADEETAQKRSNNEQAQRRCPNSLPREDQERQTDCALPRPDEQVVQLAGGPHSTHEAERDSGGSVHRALYRRRHQTVVPKR